MCAAKRTSRRDWLKAWHPLLRSDHLNSVASGYPGSLATTPDFGDLGCNANRRVEPLSPTPVADHIVQRTCVRCERGGGRRVLDQIHIAAVGEHHLSNV